MKDPVLFLTIILWTGSLAMEKGTSVKNWIFKLNTGNLVPMIGFGTWQINGTKLKNTLDFALAAGFRHIDTAEIYENEEEIGEALQELLPKHNLTRQDIFITSKINECDTNPNGYESIKNSLRRLRTDYVDLYLIHNPAIYLETKYNPDGTWVDILSKGPKNAEIRRKKWQDMVKAHKEGLVRSLGVSNYAVKHLKELLANDYGVKPSVNQIYWNPTHQSRDVLEFCKKEGILVVAYSSLGGTDNSIKLRDNAEVKKIAVRLGKSPSQILLRWPLQEGIAIIPKAKSKKHIEEDIDLDFTLPEEDVNTLNNFEQTPFGVDFNTVD